MRALRTLTIGLALSGAVLGAASANADVQALSPYDVANPAVGYLDPALLRAVQQAAGAAAADGITMTITSGWRSPEFQQQLLDDAVATYGSVAAARQYVFGLCRIYANELWHFELAADAAGVCPPLRPDASF